MSGNTQVHSNCVFGYNYLAVKIDIVKYKCRALLDLYTPYTEPCFEKGWKSLEHTIHIKQCLLLTIFFFFNLKNNNHTLSIIYYRCALLYDVIFSFRFRYNILVRFDCVAWSDVSPLYFYMRRPTVMFCCSDG